MKKINLRIALLAVIIAGALVISVIFAIEAVKKPPESEVKKSDAALPKPSVSPLAYIILDPGHGGNDHGASGTKTGTPEDGLNLDVAKKTAAELEQNNIKTMLTRYTDDAVASTKKADMKERRRIMHESGADLTVSIHMNKFSDSSVKGPMVFFTEGDVQSERLADCILQSLCTELSLPMRRTNMGDYYVIRNSNIPAVIVECGFLSNPTEEALLCNAEYRSKLAHAISEGIMSFVCGDEVKSDVAG